MSEMELEPNGEAANDWTLEFEGMDVGKEALGPNWGELEVLSNGDLSGLISSELDHEINVGNSQTSCEQADQQVAAEKTNEHSSYITVVRNEATTCPFNGFLTSDVDDPVADLKICEQDVLFGHVQDEGMSSGLNRTLSSVDDQVAGQRFARKASEALESQNEKCPDRRFVQQGNLDMSDDHFGSLDVDVNIGFRDSTNLGAPFGNGLQNSHEITSLVEMPEVGVNTEQQDIIRVEEAGADIEKLVAYVDNHGLKDGSKIVTQLAPDAGEPISHEYCESPDPIQILSEISNLVGLPIGHLNVEVEDDFNSRGEGVEDLAKAAMADKRSLGTLPAVVTTCESLVCRGPPMIEEKFGGVNLKILDMVRAEVRETVSMRESVSAGLHEVKQGNLEVEREKILEVVTTEAMEPSVMQVAEVEKVEDEAHEGSGGEIMYKSGFAPIEAEQAKICPSFVSEMLRDGSLSMDGLTSKGFTVVEDDENDSSNDDESSSSSEEDDNEELEETCSSDTEDDDELGNLSTTRSGRKREGEMRQPEDVNPPRTKRELEVRPQVPKVAAVLEPHHNMISMGCILSVLDLSVIVEASSDSPRILKESTVVWLSKSRVPLGIVDEVFGPVKTPYYHVRFNEASEIPEEAKAGVDVSYVAEFSEFIFKDDPSLCRKAIDASGADDEEVASDDEFEFSDDEKEAAAVFNENYKRRPDIWETSAESRHTKGQRRGRGKGCGQSMWHGAAMSNAGGPVHFGASNEQRGSHSQTLWSGMNQQTTRNWTRGDFSRQNSQQNTGAQESHHRGPGSGPGNRVSNSKQRWESPQLPDELYFGDQASIQMQAAQDGYQSKRLQGNAIGAGDPPAHFQGPGVPRQQQSTRFRPAGFDNVLNSDAQFRANGQHQVYTRGGSRFSQNSVPLSNPSPHPSAYLNSSTQHPQLYTNFQSQVPLNMSLDARHSYSVHAAQVNYGLHRSFGGTQTGGYPPHAAAGPMGEIPMFNGGVVVSNNRFQATPQNNQNPYVMGLASRVEDNSQRVVLPDPCRSFPNNYGCQGD